MNIRFRTLRFWAGFLLIAVACNLRPLSIPAIATSPAIAQQIRTLKNSQRRWIEINLSTQRLIAWQGKQPVYAVIISSGKAKTPTRSGLFKIYEKRRLDRMRGEDYDIPNVPFAMYYDGGYAIHGVYWHRQFGTPVSHGCINLAPDHARWLYNWAGLGTPIAIHH